MRVRSEFILNGNKKCKILQRKKNTAHGKMENGKWKWIIKNDNEEIVCHYSIFISIK